MIKYIYRLVRVIAWRIISFVIGIFWTIISLITPKGKEPAIEKYDSSEDAPSVVDKFWGVYTIIGAQLSIVKTAYQSRKYLEWRFSLYPKFRGLMDLWGQHDGEVILDYGCGAANDMVGFLENTKATKVIGIDISEKVLRFASQRIALHNIDINRVRLIKTSDGSPSIPLPDKSVDYIYCEGVLHHVSHPEGIIRDFYRVLKSNGRACIMVYNRDSIWFHLYVAYVLMLRQRKYDGMNTEQAFAKTTDSENCPISIAYKPSNFIGICEKAGFKGEFLGGYYSKMELDICRKYLNKAIYNQSIGFEHYKYLASLKYDLDGYPLYKGKYAGIGGVYVLRKK